MTRTCYKILLISQESYFNGVYHVTRRISHTIYLHSILFVQCHQLYYFLWLPTCLLHLVRKLSGTCHVHKKFERGILVQLKSTQLGIFSHWYIYSEKNVFFCFQLALGITQLHVTINLTSKCTKTNELIENIINVANNWGRSWDNAYLYHENVVRENDWSVHWEWDIKNLSHTPHNH